MKNKEIAEILYKISDLLELQGEIRFKFLAYRRAAQIIESLPNDVKETYEKGGANALQEIPGVGKGISEKIEEMLKTGKVKYYEELKSKTPIEVESLMNIKGLGPKRISFLYKKLNIKNIKQLEELAKKGKIRNLPGFGEKAEENILKAIEFLKVAKKRFVLGYVWPEILELEKEIKELKYVKRVVICGSARRRKETIGDLDILTISDKPQNVIEKFTKLDTVRRILAKGNTKSTVILKDNMQVDLRVLPKKSFGAAMQYFIGNQSHNVKLRRIAISKGYKLSEYGLFRGKKIVESEDERKIYEALGLEYIEPEMREDNGEIELAQKHKLPKLVALKDIKGDCHMHTKETDGTNTMEEMIEQAIKLGRKYIAFTDHSKELRFINGMNEERYLKQIEKIEKMNNIYEKKIKILSGAELNILDSGDVDIKDSVLKQMDIVVASIHSGFKESIEKITRRTMKAMENPHIDIIGHPTGRIISQREEFKIDMKEIFKKARATGTFLEINSYPSRLDIKDIYIKEAIKNKVKLVINTDSHNISHLGFMQFGVWQARRGWAEKKDILNTLPLDKFLKSLK